MLLKLVPISCICVSALAQTIPADSFSSLETYWNYLYPWGEDHNGGARMYADHVSVQDGVLVLTAEPVSDEPANGDIPINYRSGAIHAKDTFTVKAGGGYDFSAEFLAPVERGTWPAFWLTGVDSWPPEIDIAEWKGSGDISFNTFNTSSEVTALDVAYPNPGDWHSVNAEIRAVDDSAISVEFYLDGTLTARQYGANFVDAPLWL